MAHDLDIYELLCAYLSGDVRAEERDIVENRLAQDPALRAYAQELREFIQTLNKGVIPLREELLVTLRARIQVLTAERESELKVQALLSASLSGDLNAQENTILQRHIAHHPEAQLELQSLRVLSSNLDRGRLPVSDDLSRKLAERLNAKLPVAARIQPPAEVVLVSARPPAPPVIAMETVRVYGARQPEWGAGFGWIALAGAASIAILFGAGRLFVPPADKPVAENKTSIPEISTPDAPDQQPVVEAPKNNEPFNGAPEAPAPELVQSEVPREGRQPNNVIVVVEGDPRKSAPTPNEPKLPLETLVEETPRPTNPGSEQNPEAKKPAPKVANTPAAKRTNGISAPDVSTPRWPDQIGGAIGGNNRGGTGGVTSGTRLAGVSAIKEPEPETVSAEVTGIRDGIAQFRPEGKGEPKSLTLAQRIVSRSQINSDASRIGLRLPDDSRLFINAKSEVILIFQGNNTEVMLNAGEIAFFGGRGTITVTGPQGTTKVKDAKSVNVKIEENSLVVSNLDNKSAATVSNKLRSASLGAAPAKAIVSLDGSKAPLLGSYPANVAPHFWTEGIERNVANEQTAPITPASKGRTMTKHAVRRTR